MLNNGYYNHFLTINGYFRTLVRPGPYRIAQSQLIPLFGRTVRWTIFGPLHQVLGKTYRIHCEIHGMDQNSMVGNDFWIVDQNHFVEIEKMNDREASRDRFWPVR